MTKEQFFRESIANCKRILAEPNVRYPNGKMSHDVNADYLEKLTEEFDDYCLEYGQFNAYGKLVSFAQSDNE